MRQTGFTLLELLIAVAVVGILSTIALPTYSSYMTRSKITDAVTGLSDYRIKMEQYFQDQRNYGPAGAACPVAVPTSPHFTFACSVGNVTPSVAYAATATSSFGPAGAYEYVINQQNAKATTVFKGASVAKPCWLIRGSEC